MTTELEKDITAALTHAAQRVQVPGVSLPDPDADDPTPSIRRRRTFLPVIAASLAVIAVVSVATWTLAPMRDSDETGPTSPPATGRTSTGPSSPTTDRADWPALSLGRGDSIVAKGVTTPLGDRIVAIDSGSNASVARTADGRIWQHSAHRGEAKLIGSDASVGPALSASYGSALWIEGASGSAVAVVQPLDPPAGDDGTTRIPLPDAARCCTSETVLGMDQHGTLYLGTEQGMWIVYLGEFHAPDPAWTPVSGLAGSRLVRVSADEVIVQRSDGPMGWGYVEPTTSAYTETGHVTFSDLWFLPDGVVAMTGAGQLVNVGSTVETNPGPDGVVRPTHRLREPRFDFNLPADAHANGLAAEGDGFLVDLTLADGDRGWYRCTLTSPACTLALDLEPEDVTPGSIE